MSLEDLAHRAREGDADALRELWRRRRRWIAGVLLAHAPRGADLEDLLQEVGLTIVRTISSLRDPAGAEAWMRRIAINAARSAGRSRTRRRRAGLGATPSSIDCADASPGPDGLVEARDEAERLLDAAKELPLAYREPLLMRCANGMSHKAIAGALGVPVTTVETRLARARRMLREALEGHRASADIAAARGPRQGEQS